MSRPSLIALPLEEAREALRLAGITAVEVSHTAPPRGRPGGMARVVRERYPGEVAELTVAEAVPGLERRPADR